MDNTKDFKDNYKYNVKKVLQIIEKEKMKQENQTKVDKKIERKGII